MFPRGEVGQRPYAGYIQMVRKKKRIVSNGREGKKEAEEASKGQWGFGITIGQFPRGRRPPDKRESISYSRFAQGGVISHQRSKTSFQT